MKKRSIEENEDVEFLQEQNLNHQENKNLIEKNENIESNSDQGTVASNLKVEVNNLQEVKHSIWNVFESIGRFIYTFFNGIINWFKGTQQENIEIRTDYQSIDNNFVKIDESTTSKILEADQNLHHDNDLI